MSIAERSLCGFRLAEIGILSALASLGANAGPACETISRNEAVAVVVCPPKLEMNAWREAGIAACRGTSSCNAWIWDDASKAPKSAPATDAGLRKSETGAARAIWIADSERLIVLRQSK